MKLDSESYHHICPHEHDTKVIVHNDNSFILAKDNHFMIDMLNVDKEAIKEGNHGFTSPTERKSAKGTSPPKQCLNMEDSNKRKQSDDECREAVYSSPTSSFEMVVKEDFYTDKIVTKVELPKNRVCIEDDPRHIVKDISIDEGVHSSDRNLVDKEEVSPTESYTSIIDKDQAYPDVVLHKDFDGKVSSLDSFDNGVKLGATAAVISNLFSKVTENSTDQVSAFHNDCDVKGSSVTSINSESNLATNESVSSNISANVTESPAVPEYTVHNGCDEKGSSMSSENCGGMLDITESVSSNISPEVIENPTVPEYDVHNDCDGKGSSASSDNCKGKLDTSESVVPNLIVEATENQLPASEEATIDSLQAVSSCQIFSNDQKQSVGGQKIQAISEEYNSGSTLLSFPSEVSVARNVSEETPVNCKVLSGVITFSFDKEAASTSGRNENKETTDTQQPEVSLDKEAASTSGRDENKEITDTQQPEVSLDKEAASTSGRDENKETTDTQQPEVSLDKEAASTSGRDENKETTDTQQREMAQNGPRTEEAMVDGSTASPRSSFHLIQGESNLYGSALLSGPVANSGHIPYSGSISLRSDSSTTSARSFAFPILQSEWNSSPVKMAKADRRHLRKHRGWKMGLLCCRF